MEQPSKVSRSWSKEEDEKLRRQINAEANQNWKSVATKAGLKRSANSCRLRYVNHLKPRARPGKLTVEEKLLVLEFRSRWGGKNRWAEIAKHLRPGRRDNDVKNYWHGLAKRAKREGRDVGGYASLKRAELVEKIRAAGKFSMDYSSSISADAFEKLKELFPDLAAAGGGAVAEVAASSSFTGSVALASDLGISNDLASSSAATDIGAADAVTSCYSVEFGPIEFGPGHVDYGDVSKFEPTAEVDLGFNFSTPPPTEISNPEQLLDSGLVDDGGGPTGLNQVQAAAFQLQGSEYSTPAGQQQQLAIINSEDLYLGGGPAEFNRATVAADAVTSCYSVEFGLGRAGYGDFSKKRAELVEMINDRARFDMYYSWLISSDASDFLYYGGDPGAAPGSDPVPEAEPVQQQLVKTRLFHRPTGFNELPAALGIASTETSNQTLNHMQVEQQGLNGGCLDHGGGPIKLNEAMAAAAALGNTTSNEIDNAEEELDENKAFAEYFNFDDF